MRSDDLWDELKALSTEPKGPIKPTGRSKKNVRRAKLRAIQSCKSKRGFKSEKAARKALRAKRAGFRARIYLCEPCGHYHIANRDK